MKIAEQNPSQFSIAEVVELLNYPVIKSDRGTQFLPENIGLIVGVLVLNDEVEMVVKFVDRVTQFTKSEFYSIYRIIRE